MVKDPKALIAVAVVAILIIAGVAVVINNNNNGSKTHDNLADMSWDEIVDKAKGTTVNIGFYFDTYCVNWFNDVLVKEAKERYDITLTHAGYMTDTAAINEYKNSGKISFDLFWGRASNYVNLINYDGNGNSLILQSDWESKMPNMKYSDGLADGQWKAAYETVYGEGTYSRDVSSVAPFSGSTTSFVYNKNFNDASIAWNEVKISHLKYDMKIYAYVVDYTETITIANDGVAFDGTVDKEKVYSLDSVREYRKANQSNTLHINYGLPHNYTELNAWSQIYDQQFYLPSPMGGANFQVQLILEAMIYELASKGDSWIACTDSTADVWSGDLKGKFVTGDDAANKATYMAYINEKILSHKGITTEQYLAEVPYVKAYLQETAKFWNKGLTGTTSAVTVPNQSLVGNKDTSQLDFDSSTIMIALNSTESLANRASSYNCPIGVYAPDTVCSNRCGLFLMEHTDNPYGAIVIANLFNDPEIQAQYYSIAGNGCNLDYDTLSEEQYNEFKSRWTDWDALERPYIKPEQIMANMVMPAIGHVETVLSEAMNQYIKAS